MKIFADRYEIKISVDTDFGRHQADEGYGIIVTPIKDGIQFIPERVIANEITRIAAEELGFDLPFDNATELYEYCEEDVPEAIEVDKYSRQVVLPRLFEQVTIALTPEQIAEIDREYPGRDNNFATEVTGWVRKQVWTT